MNHVPEDMPLKQAAMATIACLMSDHDSGSGRQASKAKRFQSP